MGHNMEKVEDTLHREGLIAGCNGSVQVWEPVNIRQ